MRGWSLVSLVVGLSACRSSDKIDVETDTGALAAVDADGDGYDSAEDCDDSNSLVSPGADEICDGADNDCDGEVDEDVTTTYYADADADGFGDALETAEACELPDGYVTIGNDCDDTDLGSHPGAAERCDDVDNDCDGEIDEDVTTTFYADADADGYGDPAASAEDCDPEAGYVADDTDCDDTDASSHPGGTEVCDEADNDCDTLVDEEVTTTFYVDADADGYGDPDATTEACALPTGYAELPGDCDDTTAAISPDAPEVCNGFDDDCDGDIDDDDSSVDISTGDTFYADSDGDGYGDVGDSVEACAQPSGTVSDDTDCDDTDAAVSPDGAEVCNGIDDDCDGDIDDDDADVDTSTGDTFYADADGDGYGDVGDSVEACGQPSGTVSDATDCDDTDAAVSPAGEEVCNAVDDDCDGDIDEDDASDAEEWYGDGDGDGYGDADDAVVACAAPSGTVGDDGDCDDADAAINPGASEVCDGVDDDCDGDIDEGLLGEGAACPADDCLSILEADSSAADGDYWIDFDGVSTETECDMTTDGGGWTLLFEDDFEATPDSGWSLSSTYNCSGWSYLLGGYGIMAGGEIDITVDVYGLSHTEAWVELEYAKLDSWDGEEAYVDVDSANVWSEYLYYYEGSEVCGWNRGYNGSYDELHVVSEVVAHTADNLTLVAGSALNQSSTDESFGIDDVFVWVR